MLRKTVKDLGKHSLIYLIGGLASAMASIVLLPVYTRFLSKADYGILEIIDTTRYMLIIVLLAGFDPTMGKFYHGTEAEDEKRAAVSTAFAFVLTSAIFWTGCLFLMNDFLAERLLGGAGLAVFMNLGIVLLFAQAMQTTGETYLNIRKKSLLFVSLSLCKLTLNVGANLTFIIALRLGPKGMLYGELLSTGVTASILIGYLLRQNGLRVRFALLSPMLKFGLPFIPNALSASLMHRVDRYLLQELTSLADVGLYGVGFRFPFMLNFLMLSSFGRIWYASGMYDVAKQENYQQTHAKIATYFVSTYIICQYMLAVMAPTIIRVLAAPDYFEAWKVLQVIALACCFYSIHPFFTTAAFIKNKTWYLPISHLIPALLSIGLNWTMLPRFGYMAAAFTTIATYSLYSFLNYLICRAFYPIKFEFGRMAALLGVCVLVVGASDLFRLNYVIVEGVPILEGVKEVALAVLLPLGVAISPYLHGDEKQSLARELEKVHPQVARLYLKCSGAN